MKHFIGYHNFERMNEAEQEGEEAEELDTQPPAEEDDAAHYGF